MQVSDVTPLAAKPLAAPLQSSGNVTPLIATSLAAPLQSYDNVAPVGAMSLAEVAIAYDAPVLVFVPVHAVTAFADGALAPPVVVVAIS